MQVGNSKVKLMWWVVGGSIRWLLGQGDLVNKGTIVVVVELVFILVVVVVIMVVVVIILVVVTRVTVVADDSIYYVYTEYTCAFVYLILMGWYLSSISPVVYSSLNFKLHIFVPLMLYELCLLIFSCLFFCIVLYLLLIRKWLTFILYNK